MCATLLSPIRAICPAHLIILGLITRIIQADPVSAGNTLQDLSRLRETADNTEGYIRGLFQNQPPIGWLKEYKIQNKTLLSGTDTYIFALLLHIVAIHI